MSKQTIRLFEQCCWDLRGVLTRFGPDEACCDGLTPRQCRVLRAIGEEPEIRLTDLATREGLTPGGMTRRVAPLIAGGWLRKRESSGGDARTRRLELTKKGRDALASVENQIVSSIESLWKSVPSGQRDDVLAGIQALVEAARKTNQRR